MVKAQIKSTGEVVSIDTSIESKNGTLWHVCDTQTYIFESELRFFSLDDIHDFIETWHPDYSHSDEIAWIDDLDCALNNECDDEKLARIKHDWGNAPAEWYQHKMELEVQVFSEALKSYYSNLQGYYF